MGRGHIHNWGISRGERGYLKLGVTFKGKQGIYLLGSLLEVSKEHIYCTIGVIPVVSKGYNWSNSCGDQGAHMYTIHTMSICAKGRILGVSKVYTCNGENSSGEKAAHTQWEQF